MTLIVTFDIEDDLGSSLSFKKWILEDKLIWKSGVTLLSRHISSSVSNMLILCKLAIMQIKKVSQGCRRGNQA